MVAIAVLVLALTVIATWSAPTSVSAFPDENGNTCINGSSSSAFDSLWIWQFPVGDAAFSGTRRR